MSRRPATCLRSLLTASLAATALAACGGDRHESPAPQTIAASTPSAEPTATAPPVASPMPATAPPVEAAAAEPAPTPSATEPPPAPAPAPSAKPQAQQQQPDALQWMRDSEARRSDYQRRLAEAESNLEGANLAMVTWERNVLAFKNPFLARPQLSPEDNDAIAGMDGAARVRWAEARLASVSTARAAAQKTLDELKKNPPQN